MVYYHIKNLPHAKAYIAGSGFLSKSNTHSATIGAGFKEWMDGIWPTLKTIGKYALPAALPFVANWLFNRNKSEDQKVDPSQQILNLKDKYSQFLPDELQEKLDRITEYEKTKQILNMLDKPKKPKPKPAPIEVEVDDDDEAEVEGSGLSRKNKMMLKKLVKGSGIMRYN